MNIKRITIIQLIITFVLVISMFFVFNYTVSLGILLGSGLGYFDFYYLNKKLNEVSDNEIPDLKRIVKKNRNLIIGILFAVLILCSALLCFSPLTANADSEVKVDLFLPQTALEYKELTSPIDVYSDESVTVCVCDPENAD